MNEVRKYYQHLDKTNPGSLYVLIEIWNIFKQDKKLIEAKGIAKIVYRLLDSPDVPNHLWVKGHIICAKSLVKDPAKHNYGDAIHLLKGLCQILPPLRLPECMYSIQKNLKVNEIPKSDKPQPRDSIFGAAPEMESSEKFEGMFSQPTLEKQVSAQPVVSRISVIDEQHSQYINELQETRKNPNNPDVTPFQQELAMLEDGKKESYRGASILQPHMRKCSAFYQQMALYQECNRTSRISSGTQRLLRVFFTI